MGKDSREVETLKTNTVFLLNQTKDRVETLNSCLEAIQQLVSNSFEEKVWKERRNTQKRRAG